MAGELVVDGGEVWVELVGDGALAQELQQLLGQQGGLGEAAVGGEGVQQLGEDLELAAEVAGLGLVEPAEDGEPGAVDGGGGRVPARLAQEPAQGEPSLQGPGIVTIQY
jgi:hypothetical protein